mmetsp:Transcript_33562/g.56351  ORF Transcript_33562/g.56351 Transcript_33562/m.56351 type:complete len:505 (+) Transcript_33562:269-1783(+)
MVDGHVEGSLHGAVRDWRVDVKRLHRCRRTETCRILLALAAFRHLPHHLTQRLVEAEEHGRIDPAGHGARSNAAVEPLRARLLVHVPRGGEHSRALGRGAHHPGLDDIKRGGPRSGERTSRASNREIVRCRHLRIVRLVPARDLDHALEHLIRRELDGHVGDVFEDGWDETREEPALPASLDDRAGGHEWVWVHPGLHRADAHRQRHLHEAAAQRGKPSRGKRDGPRGHVGVLPQIIRRGAVEGEVGADGDARASRRPAHALVERAHLRLGARAKIRGRGTQNLLACLSRTRRLAGCRVVHRLHPHLEGVEGVDDRLAASAGSPAREHLVEGRQRLAQPLGRGRGHFHHCHLLVRTDLLVRTRHLLRRGALGVGAGELQALEKAPEGTLGLLALDLQSGRHACRAVLLDAVKSLLSCRTDLLDVVEAVTLLNGLQWMLFKTILCVLLLDFLNSLNSLNSVNAFPLHHATVTLPPVEPSFVPLSTGVNRNNDEPRFAGEEESKVP